MKTQSVSFDAALSGLRPALWQKRIAELGETHGEFHQLGDAHSAILLSAGSKLLVSFENGCRIRRLNPKEEPRSFAFTRRDGWSTLTILSEGQSWFRDPTIYAFFDKLTDDGFFDTFENVLFQGEREAGYAACAYSVACPGATVLALQPHATMTPRIAFFDPRSKAQARIDFTSRYGYAPAMLDAAEKAFIAFNPTQKLEAFHANLFAGKNVTHLRCFAAPAELDRFLDSMDIYEDLIQAAMANSLTAGIFADQYRERRDQVFYLRWLLQKSLQAGHLKLGSRAASRALAICEDQQLSALANEIETKLKSTAKDEGNDTPSN